MNILLFIVEDQYFGNEYIENLIRLMLGLLYRNKNMFFTI